MHQRWMRIWIQFEKQITDMPQWAQETIIKDLKTTVKNRMSVMKKMKTIKENNCAAQLEITVFEFSRTVELQKCHERN